MDSLFLLKYGEIAIKGDNQQRFLYKLESNIKYQVGQHIRIGFSHTHGRQYLYCDSKDVDRVKSVLEKTFGITGFSVAYEIGKNMEAIEEAVASLAESILNKGDRGVEFKIHARRSDKSFSLDSHDIECRLGEVICERFPQVKVNVKSPGWKIEVEIRDKVYVYADQVRGQGGLPAGCAGKGTLLLSGGIDSPVAGFLVAKRGLSLDAVYFHTPPFTSEDTRTKVKDLTRILSSYVPGMSLGVVPFTDVQVKIKETAKSDEVTLLTRASMMKIADMISKKRGSLCLVTGESLSQVASQTLKSIYFTGSFTSLPVFRPLIGFDKEETIAIARKIETFEVSIRPFDDCCTIFAAKHPVIDPNFEFLSASFRSLEIDGLLEEAANKTEWASAAFLS